MFDVLDSLLICTLKSDFEGGGKVVLKTWIFFLVGAPEKNWVYTIKPTFFRFETQIKYPSLQNHFSATLKITSKSAD